MEGIKHAEFRTRKNQRQCGIKFVSSSPTSIKHSPLVTNPPLIPIDTMSFPPPNPNNNNFPNPNNFPQPNSIEFGEMLNGAYDPANFNPHFIRRPMTCTYEGCLGVAKKGGLCNRHYEQRGQPYRFENDRE